MISKNCVGVVGSAFTGTLGVPAWRAAMPASAAVRGVDLWSTATRLRTIPPHVDTSAREQAAS